MKDEKINIELITPYSKNKIRKCSYGWAIGNNSEKFSSLRLIKTFIKRNKGLVMVDIFSYLPSQIRSVEIKGEIVWPSQRHFLEKK